MPKKLYLDEKKILSMYSYNKICPKKIGEKMNCCRTLIYNILRKHKVKMLGTSFFNKGKVPPNKLIMDDKRVVELYKKEKISPHKIAKKFNCSPIVIYRILKENNIKPFLDTKFKKGDSPMNKSKTYEEFYGEEIAISMKENLRLKNLGKKSIRKGLTYEEEYGIEEAKMKKQKIRKARAKQIFPLKDSQPEVIIQNFLKQLGIEFFTHIYMKEIEHSYQCDIFIPSTRTIIECDGDFIHCNPDRYSPDFIRYPKYETKTAKDIWERDNARTKELLEKGYNVIRIWENKIKKMSLEDFKEKLNKNI